MTITDDSPRVLDDGRWALRGRVQVWIANPKPTPEELAELKARQKKAQRIQRELQKPRPTMSPDAFICAAALHFGLHPGDIAAETRHQPWVDARSVAMWLLRRDNHTFKEIAALLDRDHTTVIYNVRRVQRNEDLLAIAHRIRVRLIGEEAA